MRGDGLRIHAQIDSGAEIEKGESAYCLGDIVFTSAAGTIECEQIMIYVAYTLLADGFRALLSKPSGSSFCFEPPSRSLRVDIQLLPGGLVALQDGSCTTIQASRTELVDELVEGGTKLLKAADGRSWRFDSPVTDVRDAVAELAALDVRRSE